MTETMMTLAMYLSGILATLIAGVIYKATDSDDADMMDGFAIIVLAVFWPLTWMLVSVIAAATTITLFVGELRRWIRK